VLGVADGPSVRHFGLLDQFGRGGKDKAQLKSVSSTSDRASLSCLLRRHGAILSFTDAAGARKLAREEGIYLCKSSWGGCPSSPQHRSAPALSGVVHFYIFMT
jgi:hypothetical protein